MTKEQPLQEGSLLWSPSKEVIDQANITAYRKWINQKFDARLENYTDLWRWSVENIEDFWESLIKFFNLKHSGQWTTPLIQRIMPGANWFEGIGLNYAENIFAKKTPERPMMFYKSETEGLREFSWEDVYNQANRFAQVLREHGVSRGDRVVAFMPNVPETIIAFLAIASLGAVWSSCSPDFGSRSVLDRFTQIEPKILIAIDGYPYNGKIFDRREVIAELQASLPTLERTILVTHFSEGTESLKNTTLWQDALQSVSPPEKMVFEQLPFDHPLWVLYSSGTTGLPKPIVHGHGGVLLEHAKSTIFHNDLKPGDRFFWYTSTGWMMWNYQLGSLLSGASIIVYNGSPGFPNMNVLFDLAEESGMTYLGISAAFVSACIKAGIHPNKSYNLKKIRGVGSTGSPLTVDGFKWVYDNINPQLALESLSGGTDLCTAFVGGARTQPIYAGEIQGASLGAKVQAYNEAGKPIVNEVGELVITEPMPSMPIYFWNDPEMARYKSSYFDMYPGIWRHGDWIQFNDRGGCVIYGRSDSTINRQGIRMGTSEIYRVVESFEEIIDSLIIDLELLGRESYLPLFVVLREGLSLGVDLIARVKQKLRTDVSPRHVPNEIIQIKEVPYTLSGKKMEVPIRKILLGMDVGKAANPGAMRNPETIDFFVNFAKEL